MATATQIKTEVDSLILERLQDKAIDRYSLADGRSVQKAPLGDLLKVRSEFAAEALADSNGSNIQLFRWIT